MAKDIRQTAALLQTLLRATGGKLSPGAMIALVACALLYVFLLQPLAEKHLGLALPGLGDAQNSSPEGAERRQAPQTDRETDRGTAEPFDLAELAGLMTDEGRGVYRSPAGLRYTRGSQQGHRLAHVMEHAHDQPGRVGQHGVFRDPDPTAVFLLVDEAYKQALDGRDVRTEREGDQTVYNVDLGRRIGYVGGQSGGRRGHPAAEHVRIVVIGDRLITAFPFRE